jgi:hypothetical protein
MKLKVVAKPEDPPGSDRSALVAALAAKAEADEAVKRQKNGIDRARALVRAAVEAVEAATKGLTTIHEEHAAAIAEAAASDTQLPTAGAVRMARQKKIDAEDELETAKQALDQLKATLPEFEANAREKNIAIDVEISLLLAPYARQLLAKAIALRSQYSPVISELWAVFADSAAAKPFNEHRDVAKGQAPLAEIRKEIEIFFETFAKFDRTGVNDPYKSFRERARENPYAEANFAALDEH